MSHCPMDTRFVVSYGTKSIKFIYAVSYSRNNLESLMSPVRTKTDWLNTCVFICNCTFTDCSIIIFVKQSNRLMRWIQYYYQRSYWLNLLIV